MTVRISSTSFIRYLAAQSTTRVARVREAKRLMLARHDDYKLLDYWLVMREASIGLLTGATSSRQFGVTIAGVNDSKKITNYRAAADGLQKWIGRKKISARPVASKVWMSSGLEVSVTPELAVSWTGGPAYVLKLYFGAEPLSKYGQSAPAFD